MFSFGCPNDHGPCVSAISVLLVRKTGINIIDARKKDMVDENKKEERMWGFMGEKYKIEDRKRLLEVEV